MKTNNCNIKTVKKVQKYNDFVKNYLKENRKNWLSSEEQKMIKNQLGYSITNEQRGKTEVYLFKKEKPKKYFLYINESERIATTWNGEILGKVFMGSSYKSNFGDKRRNIDVIGVNGIKYHGTYFQSSGDYARVTAYKNQ